MITLKDIVYFFLGIVVGLIAGVALYWLPLGQFCNEWGAVWNLSRKRFNFCDEVSIAQGTELKSTDGAYCITVQPTSVFQVKHDEGVAWIHISSGWVRARILHVFLVGDPDLRVYKVCHLHLV